MTDKFKKECRELLDSGYQIHEVARMLNVDIGEVELLVFGYPGSCLDDCDPYEFIGLL